MYTCVFTLREGVYIFPMSNIQQFIGLWMYSIWYSLLRSGQTCWRLCLSISRGWRICLSTFRKRIYTAYSIACAVVIKIIKIKVDKCKDFNSTVCCLFFFQCCIINFNYRLLNFKAQNGKPGIFFTNGMYTWHFPLSLSLFSLSLFSLYLFTLSHTHLNKERVKTQSNHSWDPNQLNSSPIYW